jgi:4'-phosphopantetheinyl transferase
LRPEDRAHRLAARGLLRLLLGRYLGMRPGEIELASGTRGKPLLAGPAAASGIRFNLSHSHGLAAFAFTRGKDIGIDVEKIRPEFASEAIAQRFYARNEVARLHSIPRAERTPAFFECWARKEAYLKARGDGLWRGLNTFEVAFGHGVTPALLWAEDDPEAATRWTVVDLQPAEGYAGALVCEGRLENLQRFWWKPERVAQ